MKIAKIAISLLLVVCSLLSVSCVWNYFGISELSIMMPAQVDLFAGQTTENMIVRVASIGNWNSADVKAVVADQSIVRIDYMRDAADKNAIRFEIKGLKKGVTSFFFETTDGKVRSNVITVVVDSAYTEIKFQDSSDIVLRGIFDSAELSFLVLRGNYAISCPSDIRIVSENREVAEIVYTGTKDGVETCSIIPYSQGETYIYIQSADGEIKSEKVKVLVIHSEKEEPIYFVLNTGTKKIHLHDCYTIKKIDSENKQGIWGSIDPYLEQGYKKCGNCFDIPKEEE